MRRALGMVLVLISCGPEPASKGVGYCNDGSDCATGFCVDNACRPVGAYGACNNNDNACRVESDCLVAGEDLFLDAAVCTISCSEDEQCWPSGFEAFPSACAPIESEGGERCIIPCQNGVCPDTMTCFNNVCVWEPTGCGPSAIADPDNDGFCICPSGEQWCDYEAMDLKCCDVPNPSNGGGGGNDNNGCCRTCTSGKPCGDSCISFELTCNQPPGCAC